MHIQAFSARLTDASKGPPDHKLSRFSVRVSAEGEPIGIAASRPLPTGKAVRMTSLVLAGEVDHINLALVPCISADINGGNSDFSSIVEY